MTGLNGARADRMPGWAYRIRTAESGRGLPDWICVTTWPVGRRKPRRRRPFAFELHDTQLQLAPILQQALKRRRSAEAADREERN